MQYYFELLQVPVSNVMFQSSHLQVYINLLTPNVNYSGRTARLTSKVAFYIFIQEI